MQSTGLHGLKSLMHLRLSHMERDAIYRIAWIEIVALQAYGWKEWMQSTGLHGLKFYNLDFGFLKNAMQSTGLHGLKSSRIEEQI